MIIATVISRATAGVIKDDTERSRRRAENRAAIERICAKKLRILVVEDTARHRQELLKTLTGTYGSTVTPFETAPPAIAAFGDGSGFDLVLMDVFLPGVSGIEACRQMKTPATRARFVLMTAGNDRKVAHEARFLDIPLFRKPIDSNELRRILLRCGDDS